MRCRLNGNRLLGTYFDHGHPNFRVKMVTILSLVTLDSMAAIARLARVIVPGFPHHVTQRGNRRQPIFFEDGDYAHYRDLLAERCRKASVEVWAYCLMPNHVHLIMVPQSADKPCRKARADN